MFLTQLIRIPSIGITMYLIKFTVIYEESTKAQIPTGALNNRATSFQTDFLLSSPGRKFSSHANPEFPDGRSVSIMEFSHWGGGTRVLFYVSPFPALCSPVLLAFFVGSQAWFEQNKATASAMVSVWCTIPWGSQNQPWLRSPVVGICLGLSLRIYNM